MKQPMIAGLQRTFVAVVLGTKVGKTQHFLSSNKSEWPVGTAVSTPRSQSDHPPTARVERRLRNTQMDSPQLTMNRYYSTHQLPVELDAISIAETLPEYAEFSPPPICPAEPAHVQAPTTTGARRSSRALPPLPVAHLNDPGSLRRASAPPPLSLPPPSSPSSTFRLSSTAPLNLSPITASSSFNQDQKSATLSRGGEQAATSGSHAGGISEVPRPEQIHAAQPPSQERRNSQLNGSYRSSSSLDGSHYPQESSGSSRNSRDSSNPYFGEQRSPSSSMLSGSPGRSISLRNQKVKPSERVRLLFGTMTKYSNVNPKWIGVAELARLRAYTPLELWMLSILEETLRRELPFLQDGAGRTVVEALRDTMLDAQGPGIIPIERLEDFISKVFAGHLQVRGRHYAFVDDLRRQLVQGTVNLNSMTAMISRHASQLTETYTEFGEEIWRAQLLVVEESETNAAFRAFLEQRPSENESTLGDKLKNWLQKPLEQIRYYSAILKMTVEKTRKAPRYALEQVLLDKAVATVDNLLVDAKLLAWQTTLGQDPRYALSWNDVVPGSANVPPKELERQAAIFDLIRAEMNWVQILALFHTLFVKPLQSATSSILPPHRLERFIDTVYSFQKKLHDRHFEYLSRLQSLQREKRCLIENLVEPSGLNRFEWDKLYGSQGDYVKGLNGAIAWLEEETATNPAFELFLHDSTFQAEARGHNIYEWLFGPLEYLKRTIRRLTLILDTTPEDHEDALYIKVVLDKVQRVYSSCRQLSTESTAELALSEVANLFLWSRRGSEVDVAVDQPERRLIHSGKAWMIVTPARENVHECHVFVLDNYMLITYETEHKGSLRYDVFRRPIPLHLLEIHINKNRDLTMSSGDRSVANPVSLRRKDRDEELVFLTDTMQAATIWKQRLSEAIRERLETVGEKHQFMQLRSIQQFFRSGTCSLSVQSNDPTVLLACNISEAGIFQLQPVQQPKLALNVTSVKQMGLFDDYLIVLASKCVTVYPLNQVLDSTAEQKLFQTIHNAHEVQSFLVHHCGNRQVLILHRRNQNHDIFELYKPVPNTHSNNVATSQVRRRLSIKPNFLARQGYFEFHLPCFSILSLKARLVLVTDKDFYFTTFDLGSIQGRVKYKDTHFVSFSSDQRVQLADKCHNSVPLTLIKVSNADDADFLLCYPNIGVYMDSQGRLTGRSLEWLSLSVNRVISYPPFALVFGSQLIEVRRASTGRLEQVIPLKKDFHITWDGRNCVDGGSNTVHQIHLACSLRSGDSWQELLELTLSAS